VIGALTVLSVEFVSGVVCNIWLKFGIWDYSTLPLNVLGQICLPFGIIWFFLCPFAFWFDDFARWCLYDEVTELKPLWKVYLECLMFWKKR
jgi:hypothetical protein